MRFSGGRKARAGTVLIVALLAAGTGAGAQVAEPGPGVETAAEAPAQTVDGPDQPPPYTYAPAGRRDPFVSLIATGQDARPTGARPEGLAGLLINEIAVRGIVQSQGTYLAMIQAPDSRTYVIREGDRLFDGTVTSISAETVVFVQEVNDPLSLERQREIRRSLRASEEGI